MKKPVRFLALGTLIALTGCGEKPVTYEDPASTQTLTTNIDLPDVMQITGQMVNSMLSSPQTADITAGSDKPIVIVDRVQNRTDQHIDTESITDSIRTQLIQSGQFRFTDKPSRGSQSDEFEWQQRGGLVNKELATPKGQQFGAEYMVTGAIVSYVTSNNKQRRKAYKCTMNLINIRTGLIVWADEKPIIKAQRR